jgi:hypothetical protein
VAKNNRRMEKRFDLEYSSFNFINWNGHNMPLMDSQNREKRNYSYKAMPVFDFITEAESTTNKK